MFSRSSEVRHRPLRSMIRRGLGHVYLRLEACASELRAERRRRELEQGCRIDPSSVFGHGASVINCRHDPDAIVIGPACVVMGQLTTFPEGGRIELGSKVFVGEGTRIWSAASITIGSYVLISHNVNIYDNNSHSTVLAERRAEIDAILPSLALSDMGHDTNATPIVIEDDTWIGFNAMIKGGVCIGRGAIVGAGTFVTEDVPPFSVVVGNPMRIIRTSTEESRSRHD